MVWVGTKLCLRRNTGGGILQYQRFVGGSYYASLTIVQVRSRLRLSQHVIATPDGPWF